MTFEPGRIIDRYILDGVLGEGGMAIVYRARHRKLNSVHAIKRLKVTDPTIRDRLIQEGRLQSGLRHPNIVSVTDLVTIEDAPALVMEYVDGPNLSQLLARKRLTLKQCDALAVGILKGVAAAHRHGLVHRDLKPANILVCETGTEFIPKIADFGLAKLLARLGDADGLTQEGAVMGTPSYMSPEQVSDSKNVDSRADIFSLGAILYELVCGRKCFDRESAIETWLAISQGEFVAPKIVHPNLPERMVRAIEGALTVDRNQRIGRVKDLMEVWSSDDGLSISSSNIDVASKPIEYTNRPTDPQPDSHSDLAFEQTRDSQDERLPISGLPSQLERIQEQTQPSRNRSGLFGSLVLGVIAVLSVVVWTQDNEVSHDNKTQLSETSVPATEASSVQRGETVQINVAAAALLQADFVSAQRHLLTLGKQSPSRGHAHELMALTYFFTKRTGLEMTESARGGRWARQQRGWQAQMSRLAERSRAGGTKDIVAQWETFKSGHLQNPIVELSYLVSTRHMQKTTQLLAHVKTAQTRFPKHPVFVYLELCLLHETGQYGAWLKRSRLAQLRFPKSTRIELEAGRALLGMGRSAKAEKIFKSILTQDSTYIDARVELAKVYAQRFDEAQRQRQFLLSLSDAVTPADQLYFLKEHGITMASLGRLSEADKLWVFCLKEAQKSARHIESLECSQAALDAYYWMAPVERWTAWFNRMESALALPGFEINVREHHSQSLLRFKASAALRRVDLPLAKKLSDHLTTTKTSSGGVYGRKAYEETFRFETALQRRDATALRSALANLKTLDTLFDRGPSCSYAFRSAQSTQSLGELASAATAFSDIMDGKCRPGEGHAYVVAESQIQLIGLYLGQQMTTKAQGVFKRFKQNWPDADSWLTASRRMKEFQDLLPK